MGETPQQKLDTLGYRLNFAGIQGESVKLNLKILGGESNMSINSSLQKKREEILTIAHEHGIQSIKLFGSVARQEDQNGSDIDLLVSFEEGRSLFDLIRFKQEIEDLIGRPVDVVTENSIHWTLKEDILSEATPL